MRNPFTDPIDNPFKDVPDLSGVSNAVGELSKAGMNIANRDRAEEYRQKLLTQQRINGIKAASKNPKLVKDAYMALNSIINDGKSKALREGDNVKVRYYDLLAQKNNTHIESLDNAPYMSPQKVEENMKKIQSSYKDIANFEDRGITNEKLKGYGVDTQEKMYSEAATKDPSLTVDQIKNSTAFHGLEKQSDIVKQDINAGNLDLKKRREARQNKKDLQKARSEQNKIAQKNKELRLNAIRLKGDYSSDFVNAAEKDFDIQDRIRNINYDIEIIKDDLSNRKYEDPTKAQLLIDKKKDQIFTYNWQLRSLRNSNTGLATINADLDEFLNSETPTSIKKANTDRQEKLAVIQDESANFKTFCMYQNSINKH